MIDSWVGVASVRWKLAPGYCGSKDQVMVKLWPLNACGCRGPLNTLTVEKEMLGFFRSSEERS